MLITLIIAFVFGAIYGSFLNVLLWRLPERRSIGGRSRCRACGQTLAWYDLIPIVSFIMLSGRCRHCQSAIHIRYPIVEAVSGAALALLFAYAGPMTAAGWAISVFGVLIMTSLFFFDLFYLILPDVFIFTGLIGYALYDIKFAPNPESMILSTLLITAFFAILYAGSHGAWLGFGDVKLAALIGLMLGYPLNFFAIVGGIWLGAGAGIIMILTRRATMKYALPFGAFLAVATIFLIIIQHETFQFSLLFR